MWYFELGGVLLYLNVFKHSRALLEIVHRDVHLALKRCAMTVV